MGWKPPVFLLKQIDKLFAFRIISKKPSCRQKHLGSWHDLLPKHKIQVDPALVFQIHREARCLGIQQKPLQNYLQKGAVSIREEYDLGCFGSHSHLEDHPMTWDSGWLAHGDRCCLLSFQLAIHGLSVGVIRSPRILSGMILQAVSVANEGFFGDPLLLRMSCWYWM